MLLRLHLKCECNGIDEHCWSVFGWIDASARTVTFFCQSSLRLLSTVQALLFSKNRKLHGYFALSIKEQKEKEKKKRRNLLNWSNSKSDYECSISVIGRAFFISIVWASVLLNCTIIHIFQNLIPTCVQPFTYMMISCLSFCVFLLVLRSTQIWVVCFFYEFRLSIEPHSFSINHVKWCRFSFIAHFVLDKEFSATYKWAAYAYQMWLLYNVLSKHEI